MTLDEIAATRLYWEDLPPGVRFVTGGRTITEADVVGFAGLTSDFNRIHVDSEFAQHGPFGQRIAHGLYTASLISAVLGTRLPGAGAVYRSQTLNFHAPVRIGDVVTVVVEVKGLVREGRKVRLYCEALVDNRLVLDGEAIVSVPSRPKSRIS